jgi:ATP-dependent DNA ligase
VTAPSSRESGSNLSLAWVCLVVGWTDPEGRRPYLGALLLAFYDPDGRLVYAGRAGTGIKRSELERLFCRLQPLATDKIPLDMPPPRTSRFGSLLVLPAYASATARRLPSVNAAS